MTTPTHAAVVLSLALLAGCGQSVDAPPAPVAPPPPVEQAPVAAPDPEPAPGPLSSEQNLALMTASLKSSTAPAHVSLILECMMQGCAPKADHTPAKAAEKTAAIRTELVAAYREAIAAAEGRPAIVEALKETLTKTTRMIDAAMPQPSESLVGWRLRHSTMVAELSDARARLDTEIELARE